jgi:Dolichyl-phosphate-mannose-protein mannosyltransferase
VSTSSVRDPFVVVDVDDELVLAQIGEERLALPLETYLSRGLLALAIVLVLWVGVRLAVDSPNYGTGSELYQVAFAEQIAQHGTPPVLGKDSFEVDPTGALPRRTVAIRGLEPPVSGPPVAAVNVPYPQQLSLERPYLFYLVAPVSWVVPWRHRLLALRLLCVLVTCLSVGFLWAAVREAWPANPLAAGVAAIVLATMSGLVAAFATFQPEAWVLALWCAGMWLVLRDARRRACSAWTVAVWTAATCMSSVAVPAAVAAIVYTSARARGAGERGHRVLARLAAVLAPTLVWVVWNLHAYGDPWPLNVVAGSPNRPRKWHGLTQVLESIFGVNRGTFDGIYNAGVPPLTRLDARPAGFVAVSLAIALVMALLTGRIAFARLGLARFGVLLVASFLSIYLTLFLSTVVAGAQVDYGASQFAGYAAAWAGVAGIGFTAPLGGRRWLAPAAIAGLTLALVLVMLRTPVA